MNFMPGDDPMIGSLSQSSILAAALAEDWLIENADPSQLIAEAEELLLAVDLAISGADFSGDPDGELMRRSWAFIGPGILTDLARIKASQSRNIPTYTRLAIITMALTIRRQSLELNSIFLANRAKVS